MVLSVERDFCWKFNFGKKTEFGNLFYKRFNYESETLKECYIKTVIALVYSCLIW